jgi:hypothetical protein
LDLEIREIEKVAMTMAEALEFMARDQACYDADMEAA